MLTTTHRGVTLIELLIGLAVLGIVLMLALPSFSSWIQNTAIRGTGEAITNGAQLARAEAIRRNTGVELSVGTDSSWSVTVVADGETIQERSAAEGSGNTTIAITPSTASKVTFNGLGRIVSNDDGSAAITAIKIDSSVLAAADSRDLCVVIGTGGIVRMCDPNASASDTRACPSPLPTGC
ncbi:MAG TPA: GspH/FimT family pseudopilin [Burkholderiales bacterium]|jgi:prepilin-type N-terminal cleavage/methylation domain